MGPSGNGEEVKQRQVEVLLGQGVPVADAVRQIGVTVQTYYRWRRLYCSMGREQPRQLKDLKTSRSDGREASTKGFAGRSRISPSTSSCWRSQRKEPRDRADEALFTEDIIALARDYGRHGYPLAGIRLQTP
ncbi:MAG: transposase [Pseudomonadota bacterium]